MPAGQTRSSILYPRIATTVAALVAALASIAVPIPGSEAPAAGRRGTAAALSPAAAPIAGAHAAGDRVTAALRRTAPAFGGAAAVEVRGLPPVAAAAAVAAALEEIREIESLTAPASPDAQPTAGGVGALTPGRPARVDPRLARLLDRARSFCLWSKGAHGPLGGRLYRLWGIGGPSAGAAARPTPAALAAAIESARCEGLTIDLASATVTLPEGSAVDLTAFAAGFAADRAADALRAAGATNGVVETGAVVRAFGPGPEGAGWPVELPAFPRSEGPIARLLLRDQAVAVAAADARPIVIAGDRHAGLIDQRTGHPATGAVATAAATELAIDAQALATTAFILGSRETTFLLGQLRPTPSVLWLLGTGSGRPLVTSHHWSRLATF
jgi:thiamine biosynthesis lipoprotein